MRLPRHDTPKRLPAETPREGIANDEALLARATAESGSPRAGVSGPPPAMHWWLPSRRAVVVGLGLRHRVASVVDLERCQQAGVEVLDRRAGGGAVYLEDANMLCGAIAVATTSVPADVTESYRWLGDALVRALISLDVAAERVEVAAARADRARSPLVNACYGTLSPHEVTVQGRKLVGLAQIRRRETTLYVLGILLRDQSSLADFLLVSDGSARAELRAELARRTVGLEALTSRSASEVVAAVEDAMPSVP